MAEETTGPVKRAGKAALVSIHDVMPETLEDVERVLAFLAVRRVSPVTLLVVPGRTWEGEQLTRLREWVKAGHLLAAHGWRHHASSITGFHHRMHAALISRNVAEHLSLKTREDVLGLLRKSFNWFEEHALPAPTLYVPPAWAPGAVSPKDMSEVPFLQLEVLRGLWTAPRGEVVPLPLVGFEADTRMRRWAVRRWNAWQLKRDRLSQRPLRIAIHPHDLELCLAADLERIFRQDFRFIAYPDV